MSKNTEKMSVILVSDCISSRILSRNTRTPILAIYALLFDDSREAAFSLWNVLFGAGAVLVFGWSDFLTLYTKCCCLLGLLLISLLGLYLSKFSSSRRLLTLVHRSLTLFFSSNRRLEGKHSRWPR